MVKKKLFGQKNISKDPFDSATSIRRRQLHQSDTQRDKMPPDGPDRSPRRSPRHSAPPASPQWLSRLKRKAPDSSYLSNGADSDATELDHGDHEPAKEANEGPGSISAVHCPITHAVMVDPVLAPDGYTYERKAIERWVNLKHHSPMIPSTAMELDDLQENRALKRIIVENTMSGYSLVLSDADRAEWKKSCAKSLFASGQWNEVLKVDDKHIGALLEVALRGGNSVTPYLPMTIDEIDEFPRQYIQAVASFCKEMGDSGDVDHEKQHVMFVRAMSLRPGAFMQEKYALFMVILKNTIVDDRLPEAQTLLHDYQGQFKGTFIELTYALSLLFGFFGPKSIDDAYQILVNFETDDTYVHAFRLYWTARVQFTPHYFGFEQPWARTNPIHCLQKWVCALRIGLNKRTNKWHGLFDMLMKTDTRSGFSWTPNSRQALPWIWGGPR